jgi:gamma-glutamylcyclotransferase (GGCT)/AIG2-like uncharacterized protein YtfP
MATLFVYGTLCRPAVRRRILGRAVTAVKATLKGYKRLNGKWPYLVKKPGGKVTGEILKNLTSRDLKKLDAYEEVEKGIYIRAGITLGGKKHFVYLPDLSKWPKAWQAPQKTTL